jgi:hypothetical protein
MKFVVVRLAVAMRSSADNARVYPKVSGLSR